MKCPVMVQLILRLDALRAEQSKTRGDIDKLAKKKRLRAIEEFVDRHQKTCLICRQGNPQATRFDPPSNH